MTSLAPEFKMALLATGVALLLLLASIAGRIWQLKTKSSRGREMAENLNSRIRAWWIMAILFLIAINAGDTGSLVLFGLISFLALREYITLTPTQPADHRILFWAFFVITPLQYLLICIRWYGLFSIFIPVYAYMFVPIRNVIAGDFKDFLARSAKIQWGLMVCVYFVSHAPALLDLKIPGYEGQNANLLFFLVAVVQLSDVLQYIFGKCFGYRPIAPNINPDRTVEGLAGGAIGAVLFGTLLWWITPFSPWQSALMALIIAITGFGGELVMSSVKLDRGVKDYGLTIPGNGRIMHRIDSLCFAAPIFFHLTRYYFT
jgi:phosphatidate cytidylyltransferase